jgi:hypothetical protein
VIALGRDEEGACTCSMVSRLCKISLRGKLETTLILCG